MHPSASAALQAVASDDAGAQTANRYDWQASMAAADGLGLYLRWALQGAPEHAAGVRVVCEHLEDWIIVAPDLIQVVSAKHLDPAAGSWTTVAQLVDDGGLAHLFATWLQLGMQVAVRMVTNGGIKTGPARRLQDVCGLLADERKGVPLPGDSVDRVGESIRALAAQLMLHRRGLPEDWQAPPGAKAGELYITGDQLLVVRQFTSMLTLDSERPDRSLIPYAAPSMYMQPVLTAQSMGDAGVHAAWSAVQGLFATRMRAQGEQSQGGLTATVQRFLGYTEGDKHGAEIARRSVSLEDIATAMRTAIQFPGAYGSLPDPSVESRISLKMRRGGCPEGAVQRAEMLRLDYIALVESRKAAIPGEAGLIDSMRRLLLKVVEAADSEIDPDAERRGAEVWRAIQAQIANVPTSERPLPIDDDLMLGGVSALVANCRVWFSHRFDVDRELRVIRGGEAT